MRRFILRPTLLLYGALLCGNVVADCPSAESNAVEIKFYRADVASFLGGSGEKHVAVAVAAHASVYCPSEITKCSLQSSLANQFNETDVHSVAGFPRNSLKDMIHKIYVTIPANDTCVLRKQFVKEILGMARDNIHDNTGYWITYVDDEFYGIPPPTTLNNVLIPIMFAALFGLIIATVVLNRKNANREAAERRRLVRQALRQRSKGQARPDSGLMETRTGGQRPRSKTGTLKKRNPFRNDNHENPSLQQDSHDIIDGVTERTPVIVIEPTTTNNMEEKMTSLEKMSADTSGCVSEEEENTSAEKCNGELLTNQKHDDVTSTIPEPFKKNTIAGTSPESGETSAEPIQSNRSPEISFLTVPVLEPTVAIRRPQVAPIESVSQKSDKKKKRKVRKPVTDEKTRKKLKSMITSISARRHNSTL